MTRSPLHANTHTTAHRWTTLKKGVTLPQISATPSFFASHASSSLRASERPRLSQTMVSPTNEDLHIPTLADTVLAALNPQEQGQAREAKDLQQKPAGERTRAERERVRRPVEETQRRSEQQRQL